MQQRGGLILWYVFLGIFSLMYSLFPYAAYTQESPATVPVVPGSLGEGITVMPRELNLGILSAAKPVAGEFYLKNEDLLPAPWALDTPQGWSVDQSDRLQGTLGADYDVLRVAVTLQEAAGIADQNLYNLRLTIARGDQSVHYRKEAAAGIYRDFLRLDFVEGPIFAALSYQVAPPAGETTIRVEPGRLEFGAVEAGATAVRKVKVTNAGPQAIRWTVSIPKKQDAIPQGRYVSFINNEMKGKGAYTIPVPLISALETSGRWGEDQGFPAAIGEKQTLTYRFTGTAISLIFLRDQIGGQFTVAIDDKPLLSYNTASDSRGEVELLIAEGLALSVRHTLTVTCLDGYAVFTGVAIRGIESSRIPSQAIRFFPAEGVTAQEIDFVTISVNTKKLLAGTYAGQVLFDSNRGQATLDIYLDVTNVQAVKTIDVQRYLRQNDVLYTVNPEADGPRVASLGYVNQGLAFRLFKVGTPGTTEFYRWYHPQRKEHFYAHDLKAADKLPRGFKLEGPIAGIATSRLGQTRELYRFWNPQTGHYFFTTDIRGEGRAKAGYRYDGMAGYVR